MRCGKRARYEAVADCVPTDTDVLVSGYIVPRPTLSLI
jgi:hypothetical protein